MVETCENCRFWRRGQRARYGDGFAWVIPPEDGRYRGWGDCRFGVPMVIPTDEGGTSQARTYQDDWCGEHQPVEAKETVR